MRINIYHEFNTNSLIFFLSLCLSAQLKNSKRLPLMVKLGPLLESQLIERHVVCLEERQGEIKLLIPLCSCLTGPCKHPSMACGSTKRSNKFVHARKRCTRFWEKEWNHDYLTSSRLWGLTSRSLLVRGTTRVPCWLHQQRTTICSMMRS